MPIVDPVWWGQLSYTATPLLSPCTETSNKTSTKTSTFFSWFFFSYTATILPSPTFRARFWYYSYEGNDFFLLVFLLWYYNLCPQWDRCLVLLTPRLLYFWQISELYHVLHTVNRVEICRDRHDRRSCKICASCVIFWKKAQFLA